MDNRNIRVTSEGNEGIALALKLIWPNAPGGKATHYFICKYKWRTKYFEHQGNPAFSHTTELIEDKENGTPTLILLWSEERPAQPLPFPLDLDGTIQFVQNWLKTVEYGHEPDHDGDNHKGWHIFNEAWGHVSKYRYSIVAVQPAWAMYGK